MAVNLIKAQGNQAIMILIRVNKQTNKLEDQKICFSSLLCVCVGGCGVGGAHHRSLVKTHQHTSIYEHYICSYDNFWGLMEKVLTG